MINFHYCHVCLFNVSLLKKNEKLTDLKIIKII